MCFVYAIFGKRPSNENLILVLAKAWRDVDG